MNTRIVSLILVGIGLGALVKTFFDEDKENVKDSSHRSSGSDSGKQDTAAATAGRRDRIVINNVYSRDKRKKPAGVTDLEGKKENVKQDSGSSKVSRD
jgi:hypothetical protein